jgi:anti-sigma factor RsiW
MCDERHKLIDFVYGECDDDARRVVEAHLEQCPTCREEIGGFRRVQQDLLAWDVPEHSSVWRPFVAVRPAPWWREVPAWAMAAAASVVFLLGAAGGVVTHALVTPESAASAQVADAQPIADPATAADVSPAQLSELEQRMVSMMRSELTQRERAIRTSLRPGQPIAAAGGGLTLDQIAGLIGESEIRQFGYVKGLNNALGTIKSNSDMQLDGLRREVQQLRDLVQQQGGGGSR